MLNWLSVYYLGSPTANGDIEIIVQWSEDTIPVNSINVSSEPIEVISVTDDKNVNVFIEFVEPITVFLEKNK